MLSFSKKLTSLPLVSLCFPLLVHASEVANNYESIKFSSVDLYLLPDTYSFVTHIDEKILDKFGCHFHLDDPEIAGELLKEAISARQIFPAEKEETFKFESRNKMIFHSSGEKEVVIVYSQEFSNLPYLKGYWNGEFVKLWPGLRGRVLEIIGQKKPKQTNDKAPQFCGI